MENISNYSGISDKELALRKMGLSQRKKDVVNISLSDGEARKQLWDKWKTKHPETMKS